MSLSSILAGGERSSSFLSGLLKPLTPSIEDFEVIDPFGTQLKVPPTTGRGGTGARFTRAFSELARISILREGKRELDTSRLEGVKGFDALRMLRPGIARKVEGAYRDALLDYRAFFAGKKTIAEMVYPAWVMAGLSLVSSAGFMRGEAEDITRPTGPEYSFQLIYSVRIWEEFHRSIVPVPEAVRLLATPCFGRVSESMGGASADLLMGGDLVEFTTVRKLSLGAHSSRLAALLVLGNSVYSSEEDTAVSPCLYFARHGVMLRLKRTEFLRTRMSEFVRAKQSIARRFGR